MKYIFLFFLFQVSYAKTINVDMGSNNHKSFEWISLNSKEILVQELKAKESLENNNIEFCLFKGLEFPKSDKETMTYQKEAKSTSIRLLRWKTPDVGKLTRPKPLKTMTAFKETQKNGRCPELNEVPENLVTRITDFYNPEQITKPFSYTVYSGEKNVTDFTGSCFVSPKDNKGCNFDKRFDFNTKPFNLSMNLKATSKCIVNDDKDFEKGCQADRTYSGFIAVGTQQFPFSIKAKKNKTDGLEQNTLSEITIYDSKDTSIAVFYFAPVLKSDREKTAVLLRLQ